MERGERSRRSSISDRVLYSDNRSDCYRRALTRIFNQRNAIHLYIRVLNSSFLFPLLRRKRCQLDYASLNNWKRRYSRLTKRSMNKHAPSRSRKLTKRNSFGLENRSIWIERGRGLSWNRRWKKIERDRCCSLNYSPSLVFGEPPVMMYQQWPLRELQSWSDSNSLSLSLSLWTMINLAIFHDLQATSILRIRLLCTRQVNLVCLI